MFLMLTSPTDSAGVKATTTLASLVSLATGSPASTNVFVFVCSLVFVFVC